MVQLFYLNMNDGFNVLTQHSTSSLIQYLFNSVCPHNQIMYRSDFKAILKEITYFILNGGTPTKALGRNNNFNEITNLTKICLTVLVLTKLKEYYYIL